MNNKVETLTHRQYISLMCLSALSVALRLVPGPATQVAGRHSWLAPLIALPLILLLQIIIAALLNKRKVGEGILELLPRALGAHLGSLFSILYCIWLILYGGFIIRRSATSFTLTIYPETLPLIFMVIFTVVAFIFASGGLKPIARSAEIFTPFILITLALIIFFGLFDLNLNNLLPFEFDAMPEIIRSSAYTFDIVGGVLFSATLLAGHAPEGGALHKKSFMLLAVYMCLFLALLSALSVALVGAELTANSSSPFFMLLRNLRVFGVFERVEAFITALWALPDFILLACIIYATTFSLRRIFKLPLFIRGASYLPLNNGRFLVIPVTVGAFIIALCCAPSTHFLERLSTFYVPLISLSFTALILLLLGIGKLRRKI